MSKKSNPKIKLYPLFFGEDDKKKKEDLVLERIKLVEAYDKSCYFLVLEKDSYKVHNQELRDKMINIGELPAGPGQSIEGINDNLKEKLIRKLHRKIENHIFYFVDKDGYLENKNLLTREQKIYDEIKENVALELFKMNNMGEVKLLRCTSKKPPSPGKKSKGLSIKPPSSGKIQGVEVWPTLYKKGVDNHDFNKLVMLEKNTLFIFNDNTCRYGFGGTAEIANKGYENVIGIVTGINNVNDKVRQKCQKVAGSSASGGFQNLIDTVISYNEDFKNRTDRPGKNNDCVPHTDENCNGDAKNLTVQEFIDLDLGKIRKKIIEGDFKKIRYSCDKQAYIGQQNFNIGPEVREYITNKLQELGEVNYTDLIIPDIPNTKTKTKKSSEEELIGIHPKRLENYQYEKPKKKGDPDIYKEGKCLFPFKVSFKGKRYSKTEEYQNCSYKSSRVYKKPDGTPTKMCATEMDKKNFATKIGVCISKPSSKLSLKKVISFQASQPTKSQTKASSLSKKSQTKASSLSKKSPLRESSSSKSEQFYGMHPNKLKINYEDKYKTFIKDNYKEDKCIFPFKLEEGGDEFTDCSYKSSRVKNANICATAVDRNGLAKKLGICKRVKCFEKKNKIESLSEVDKDCYGSDEIEEVHKKHLNPDKIFETKTFEQWYEYDINDDLTSKSGKLLAEKTKFKKYITIGDGNCLFHSIVGSFELQIEDGIKKLKDLIKEYERKNNGGKSLGGNNLAENLRNLYVHSINKRELHLDILKIFESCSAPGHYNLVYQDVLELITENDMNSLIKLEAEEKIDPAQRCERREMVPEEAPEDTAKRIEMDKYAYLYKISYIVAGQAPIHSSKLKGNHISYLRILKDEFLKVLKDPSNYCDHHKTSDLAKILKIDINVLRLRQHIHRSVSTQTEADKKKSEEKKGTYRVVNYEPNPKKSSPSIKYQISIYYNGYNHFEALGPKKAMAIGIKRVKKSRKQKKSPSKVSGKSQKKSSSKVSGKSQKKNSSPSKPKSTKKKQSQGRKKSQKKK